MSPDFGPDQQAHFSAKLGSVSQRDANRTIKVQCEQSVVQFHADYQSEVLPAHPVCRYLPSRFGFEVKKWASEYAYSLTLYNYDIGASSRSTTLQFQRFVSTRKNDRRGLNLSECNL